MQNAKCKNIRRKSPCLLVSLSPCLRFTLSAVTPSPLHRVTLSPCHLVIKAERISLHGRGPNNTPLRGPGRCTDSLCRGGQWAAGGAAARFPRILVLLALSNSGVGGRRFSRGGAG